MSQRNIGEKISKVLKEKENSERLKEFLPVWREAYKLSMELAEKSVVQLVFFFLFFALIDVAAVTKASLFGIEFNSLSIPYVILFVLSVATFYRLMLLACFAQVIEEAIRKAYVNLYRDFQSEGLSDLAAYPSLPQIENTFANLEDNEQSFFARLSQASMVVQALALPVISLVGLTWASYALIRGTVISNYWAIPIVCISWLVILRALLVGIHAIRYALEASNN